MLGPRCRYLLSTLPMKKFWVYYCIIIGCATTASSPVDRLIYTTLGLKGTAVTPTSWNSGCCLWSVRRFGDVIVGLVLNSAPAFLYNSWTSPPFRSSFRLRAHRINCCHVSLRPRKYWLFSTELERFSRSVCSRFRVRHLVAFRPLCFECGRQQGHFVRVRARLFQVANDAKQNEETNYSWVF